MDADTFDRLVGRTHLQARARRMARAVLVERLAPAEAGRQAGRRPEAARQAAARVLRELRAEGGYPRDWEAVTVVVPPEVADRVLDLARHAHCAAGLRVGGDASIARDR